jgi:hypothetical protein
MITPAIHFSAMISSMKLIKSIAELIAYAILHKLIHLPEVKINRKN